ncbi:MAG: phosphomethylpyrimidine synthase ThiC [Elusimicrobia bacterium]|nr:phosphomethylpyrimidine synthase ThiC [Elusimicrobiota bacterium]
MEIPQIELKQISQKEELPFYELEKDLRTGKAVILKNSLRKIHPVAVGKRLRCKINVNLGVSGERINLKKEIKKLKAALEYGADTLMDLSLGRRAGEIRKALIKECFVPFGTVPIYSITQEKTAGLSRSKILDEIERQALEGVDFMTLHCGLRKKHLEYARRRICPIVSRGGAIIAEHISKTGRENPFYEYFEDILKIVKKYSITVSLGDGLRPGACADANDKAQYSELYELGKLRKKCLDYGVFAMIEGPGHVPINLIEENVKKAEEICDGAPLYFLGPLTTDRAAGRDHISAAIGASLAGFHGVSLLCAVTPSEHLGIPDINDIKEAAAVFKIAAESVNLAKGFNSEREKNKEISEARKSFDWEKQFSLALDGKTAKRKYKLLNKNKDKFCSMCGKDFCAMRKFSECAGVK